MKKLKSLGIYQKGVLIFMAAIILIFTVIYSVTTAKEGYEYRDKILIRQQENGFTTYSGKIKGEPTVFTVYDDKKVEFQHGDKAYGPYVIKENPIIDVKDVDFGDFLYKIEFYCSDELLFRGGAIKNSGYWWLYHEDGTMANFKITYSSGNGMSEIETDAYGKPVDEIEPDIFTILDLTTEPEITHKGDWGIWFYGVVICMFTLPLVLFPDELFRWNLRFRIRDVETAEPSEWEMMGRYISWTVMPIFALIMFILGLQ